MWSALPALVLVSAVAAGTPQSRDTVAGAKIEIVRLDAVVADPDGNRVRDLIEADFELFEDGKRQKLTHFILVDPEGSSVPSEKAGAGAPGPTEAGEPGRYVVILVDDLHIARGELVYTKEALRRLADELLTAVDKVALIKTTSPAGSFAFAQDRTGLRDAIDTLGASGAVMPPALGADMTPAMAELVLRGDRGALKLATRRLIDDPTSFVDTSGPRAAIAAQGVARADIDPWENVAADEAERQARGILLDALRFSAATLGKLEDIVWGLAPLPGRKICLLVSDGFLVGDGTSVELTGALRGVVNAATRSGTVIYALDSEGLPSTASDAGVAGVPSRPGLGQTVARQGEIAFRKTLENLSGDTGGFLIRGATDSTGELRSMLDDSVSHYVIAYEPTNTRRDGKFRKIKLELPRFGKYTVRTRKGYLAPDDREHDDADWRAAGSVPRSLSDDAIRALLDVSPPESGIPVHLSAGFLDLPPHGSQALIRANVDLRAVSFGEADSRHRGTVELMGGVYDSAGEPVGAPFRRWADLDWSDSEHEHGLLAGLTLERALPLDPGRYQVRLLVQDARTARMGGARQWVDVPDLSNKQLAMSAVFLGSEGQVAKGVRRFKRDENLSFELHVYNPLVDAAGTSDVVLQAQIWSGGKTIAASRPEPMVVEEADGVPVAQGNSFPLAGLEPGPYELRVVVVDRKANTTISRSTGFTVE